MTPVADLLPAPPPASLELTSTPLAKLSVDALVVGVRKTDGGPVPSTEAAASLDKAFGRGGLTAALSALGARGDAEEVTRLPTRDGLKAVSVVAVGLGPDEPTADVLRRAAGAAVRGLAGLEDVALALPGQDDARLLAAVAEGAALGAYSFDTFRSREGSGKARRAPVRTLQLVVPSTRESGARAAVARATAVAGGVRVARDLVNTPPGDLPPMALAEAAKAAVDKLSVKVSVQDADALADGGYGGILGVGKGSSRPPCLVRLEHTTRRAKSTVHLVGKGITFDSGGLSLKPPKAMETMKSDMGGAAAVVGAVRAVAELGLDVTVVGWLACAENMPSGAAQRPSDVLVTYGGTTVEVLNTDAEGRLVLADALQRACEDSPDLLLDAATLTGAQLVALGARTFGVMGDDDARAEVVAAAERAGEPAWAMPMPAELRSGLDSEVADLKNIGENPNGGMLLAATFLRQMVRSDVPWAHLDIAGPAFNSGKPWGWTPKGGTGAAVATFVAVCEGRAR